jgi:phage head maturation protease
MESVSAGAGDALCATRAITSGVRGLIDHEATAITGIERATGLTGGL